MYQKAVGKDIIKMGVHQWFTVSYAEADTSDKWHGVIWTQI